MSLLGKLFGGRTLEAERAQADALFARGEFGQAKLAYERAQSLAKAEPAAQVALGSQISACRNAIAKAHLAEAERLIAEGNFEFAQQELQAVQETADDPALLAAATARFDGMERAVVRAEVAAATDPPDADRFELIAGSFEDDQYAEYMAHGEPAKNALLLLHDGRTAEARAALETLITGADGPRYLWFELGRARMAEGDSAQGAEALEKFLASLHAEEGGDARLIAHMELAQLVHAAGDFDAAVAHYEAALLAMPDDPRPYLAMAGFFRREKLSEEAIEVLESGLEALEGQTSDFRLLQELGLAHAEAGRNDEAVRWLERMLDQFTGRQQLDLPPEGTLKLAQLYEQSDRAARALDLYSLLARGSDRPNLHLYCIEAARVMQQLGLGGEARRMLQRAAELAADKPEVQAHVAALLAQQPPPPAKPEPS
jgi:tetratricopeptide (TPR) repeat protein